MRYFLLVLASFFSALLLSQNIYSEYRDGEIYLQLKPGIIKPLLKANPNDIPTESLDWLNNLQKKYGITRVRRPFHQASDHPTLPSVLKISFSKAQNINAFLEELSQLKQLDYVEKVPLSRNTALPNDPVFPAYLNQINAQNAWNVFNGNSNITVAIIDDAVMWTHQDLVANTYTNTGEIPGNNVDDDANGYIDDVNGYDVADFDNNAVPTNTAMDHGTHCAGIAGARTDNGVGVASIGWNIKIIPVKCAMDGTSPPFLDAEYEGIIYAAKAKAKVISCSWGGGPPSITQQTVIDYAWNKGCIIVCSAGNNGSSTPFYPAAYNHVYAVASVNSSDHASGFSNYGNWVDISAPGEGIYSTLPSVGTGTYGFKTGTSMACPLVAGLAALMWSKCPWMSNADVLNCISSTAVNIYTLAANATYSANSGLGAGRIEAFQAMNCANSFLSIPPLANFFAFPLNSCPNTPVTFYDSSLYAPTSYTWNFQGGTPASSSASAPVVQWASPGTYSVSLTVSNANGSHSKTKLSYISISGPQSLPFSEGFQPFAFLPPGWTEKNINYDNVYWERVIGSSAGGFGTSTACAMFDNYNYVTFGDREEMQTPKFNLSNVHTVRLRYDVAYARYSAINSDTLEVKLSLNCGSTWSLVSIKGGTTLATRADLGTYFAPTSTEWRRDTFDISTIAAGQGNVMFSFINRGQYGQPIYLDNINLFFPTPTLNINPLSTACVNTTVNPLASITGAASYTWNFPGGSPASSTQSNPSVSYNTPGTYTIQLTGENGTSSAITTRTINISAYPVLGVNTPTVCNGAAATFSPGGANAYTLDPGNLSGTLIAVSPNITTVYTLTGSNGVCSSAISATAVVNPTPVVSANNSTICTGSVANFTLSGASTYTTNPGNIPNAQFTVSPVSTTIYTIQGSNGPCTSTITASVSVNPLPVIVVNSPSLCFGESATLTASGASSYTWSTGPNSNSIIVSPNTSTTYVVSGSSLNCISSQTSNVFVNPSFTVSAQTASNNVCSQTTCSLSATGANTYSWSTGAVGQNVNASPVSTTTYVVTGTLGICSQSAAVVVTIIPTPGLNFSVTPGYSICAGGSASLQVSGNYSTFVWGQPVVFGTLNVVYPSASTAYTLNAGNPSNGCYTSSLIPITVSGPPTASLTLSNISCFGMCNGSVAAQGINGTAPYSFTLSPPNCTMLPCTNLCAGNYSLQIKDGLGCASTQSFAITAPSSSLSVSSVSMGPASCATCSNGYIQTNASGGTPPYFFIWAPTGGTNSTATDLAPGCYTVYVSDANLCTAQSTACVDFIVGLLNLDAPENDDFKLFPNPAENLVFIESAEPEFNCAVYNNLGQLVLLKTNQNFTSELNVQTLSKGAYYVELSTNKHTIRKKLILK